MSMSAVETLLGEPNSRWSASFPFDTYLDAKGSRLIVEYVDGKLCSYSWSKEGGPMVTGP